MMRRWAFPGLATLAVAVALGCGGSSGGEDVDPRTRIPGPPPRPALLAPDEVRALMESAATSLDVEMIVAVADRAGNILGLGQNFTPDGDCRSTCGDDTSPDCVRASLAMQLARTAAFFSADQTPLTSRSVRFISDIHFPPGVRNAASGALFGIENTNRGCSFDAAFPGGADYLPGKELPRVLNLASLMRTSGGGEPLACEGTGAPGSTCGCTRGIATVPGAVPIFKNDPSTGETGHAGGIGVVLRSAPLDLDPAANPERNPALLRLAADAPEFTAAEFAARAFAGDVDSVLETIRPRGLVNVCAQDFAPQCCSAGACSFSILPALGADDVAVIFIDGIEVPEVALDPDLPTSVGGHRGITQWHLDPNAAGAGPPAAVPDGWLVGPKASSPGAEPISAAEVEAIVSNVRDQASTTRAAIRLPLSARARFVIAVTDTAGELLALFRQPDATVFSVDVSVAKARNVTYFSGLGIDPLDTRDSPGPGEDRGEAFPPGTAITNRTISFASQPFYPSGIDGTDPGPLRRVFIEDSANVCTNGREAANGRQNGIVFFPGSAPLYRNGVLIGGLGVSGDGVEQDDFATFAGVSREPNFEPPAEIRADQIELRGARLPYLKFNRVPEAE